MRRIVVIAILLLTMTSLLHAQGVKLSAGAFGGVSIPVVQEDQSQGTVFGLMGRFNLMSIFVVEPHIAFGKWGAPDPIDGFDLGIDGSKITAFGVDAMIGGMPGTVGLKPYFLGGIGMYSIKNDDTGYDESKFGFSAGAGLDIGIMPMIDLDIKAKAIIIPIDEGSKKAVNITAGVLYNFGVGK